MDCMGGDEPTLPVGDGVSAPLAVLNLHAAAVGVDTLSLEYVEMVDSTLNTFVYCVPTGQQCLGATNQFVTPAPTNTPTATYTPTPTPITPTPRPTSSGVGGKVLLPPSAVSSDGKSAGGSQPPALVLRPVLGAIVGMGAAALALKRRKA